ncbi:MAG: HAD-IIIC family phosphatase [bacterium]|nr:HAD-IIIC family phosphatase [bacterium]
MHEDTPFDALVPLDALMDRNRSLGRLITDASAYDITVLSNIITAPLFDIIEYHLRSVGVPARCRAGGLDAFVQESAHIGDVPCVILWWELARLTSGFHYRIAMMSDDAVEALAVHTEQTLHTVLSSLARVPLVIVHEFTATAFSLAVVGDRRLEELAARLNRHLAAVALPNVVTVSVDNIFSEIGTATALDRRFYASALAPYTPTFAHAYAARLVPMIRAMRGDVKKVIVFDCDGTLWGGAVGEDGVDGITLDPATAHGAMYTEVQYLARALERRGVLIALASKNNPEDVDAVLRAHPHMVLRDEHIAAKLVNWEDKVTNLRAIASTLHVGLESVVFIDDSSVEIAHVRAVCPEVTAVQVPLALHEYPQRMRAVARLFDRRLVTIEDTQKTEQYRVEEQRNVAQQSFVSTEQFLQSLDLRIVVRVDDARLIPRMVQLTQKTNQFNCTTKRYTEGEITSFVANPAYRCFTFDAADRFGEYGVTGCCIVRIDRDVADFDTFLMSCRVIGRSLEYAFARCIVDVLRAEGVRLVRSSYVSSAKNAPAADFYDRLGFMRVDVYDGARRYALDCTSDTINSVPYVTVHYAGTRT